MVHLVVGLLVFFIMLPLSCNWGHTHTANPALAHFATDLEEVCVETIEAGLMMKDLAYREHQDANMRRGREGWTEVRRGGGEVG